MIAALPVPQVDAECYDLCFAGADAICLGGSLGCGPFAPACYAACLVAAATACYLACKQTIE